MRLFGIFSSFFQGTGVLKKAILSQQASILCEIMIGAILKFNELNFWSFSEITPLFPFVLHNWLITEEKQF